MSALFVALVREHDAPQVAKTPSNTLRAVAVSLADLGSAPAVEVAYAAGVTHHTAAAVLDRLRRYGCAVAHPDPRPSGKIGRRWEITVLGAMLARDFAEAFG